MRIVKQKNRKQMANQQRGFVLILALVLLAVLTLIGVSSMNSANMELRATANARQHLIAFNSGHSLLEYTLSTGALRDDGQLINYQTTAAAIQGVNYPAAGSTNTSTATVTYAGCSSAPGSSLEEGKGFSYNFFSVRAAGSNNNSGTAASILSQGARFPAAACPL